MSPKQLAQMAIVAGVEEKYINAFLEDVKDGNEDSHRYKSAMRLLAKKIAYKREDRVAVLEAAGLLE